MVDMDRIEVYPLLAEVPIDDRVRVALISLTVVRPNHSSVCLISINPDPDEAWIIPWLNVSCDEGPRLEGVRGGGGGGNGWVRWHADFLGPVPDPIGVVEVSFVDRASAAQVAAVSITPRTTSPPDVGYDGLGDADSLLADDRRLLLPTSIAPVRSAIEGVENHVVVSVEQWAHTSVVVVYTPDGHQQMPLIAPIAVGHDSIGRTYDVRVEGGGSWCGGAASHLRVTPRLPSDVDALHVVPRDTSSELAPVTLRFR
jgi:hypothetical protein